MANSKDREIPIATERKGNMKHASVDLQWHEAETYALLAAVVCLFAYSFGAFFFFFFFFYRLYLPLEPWSS